MHYALALRLHCNRLLLDNIERVVTMLSKLRKQKALHLMLLPGVILLFLFSYVPLFGIVIAFQDYSIARGFLDSRWVGLDNFRFLFLLPTFPRVIRNTFFIATSKVVWGIVVPVIFALLLNEVRNKYFKRTVQTITYLPFFLSWVILAGILVNVLSPSTGVVNIFLGAVGIEPIFFLGDASVFPHTMIWTDVIKNMGFGAVIYLAALTGIDPTYYEAAMIDGAGRLKQTFYITLPGLAPTVILLSTLALGNVLNAGFDQIFNLYSIAVYSTGDIIDTFIFRLGFHDHQFSISAAVSVFRSAISTVLIVVAYTLAYKTTGYRII